MDLRVCMGACLRAGVYGIWKLGARMDQSISNESFINQWSFLLFKTIGSDARNCRSCDFYTVR